MKILESERLIVRSLQPDDWKDLHEYLSQSRVLKYDAETVSNEEQCKAKAKARSKGNPAYWGKGYATEACRRVLQFGFEEMGAHRVEAGCSPDNPPSWRLLERLGMRREGHFKEHVFFRKDAEGRPVWLDSLMYGILDKEYTAGRGASA